MLGQILSETHGIEGAAKIISGLGLLDVETFLTEEKTLEQVSGLYHPLDKQVRGYEMHMGRTEGADCARPLLELGHGPDGAISPDGRAWDAIFTVCLLMMSFARLI